MVVDRVIRRGLIGNFHVSKDWDNMRDPTI